MKKYIRYLIIFLLFANCNDKTKTIPVKNKVVSNNELLAGWKTFEDTNIKVNIPSKWKPTTIDDALFYVPIDKDKDIYYVVLNYNISQINTRDYLKKVFEEVEKKDSKFSYILKKINFKNTNNCYYFELFSNESNVRYKIYSLIYEVGNQIYDFSYKTLDTKKTNDKNYQTFYTVLFSFEYQYDNIVDGEKFIIDNAKVLKYEDL